MELNTSIPSAPSIFNGSDYAHWNVRIRAYLRGLNDNIWFIVERGFVKPNGDIDKCSKDDVEKSNRNNSGISVIFNCVSLDEFCLIMHCEISKEAWDSLEKTHEGSKEVKKSKLQMLISRFEIIKMKEDETFGEFYTQLSNTVNSIYGLGEKVSEVKTIEKILCSLPP